MLQRKKKTIQDFLETQTDGGGLKRPECQLVQPKTEKPLLTGHHFAVVLPGHLLAVKHGTDFKISVGVQTFSRGSATDLRSRFGLSVTSQTDQKLNRLFEEEKRDSK